MKIDYELVEKIGATHYKDYLLYKVERGELFVRCNGRWSKSELAPGDALLKVKPIPPARVEYEKVTESIFDLRDEFERGELYFDQGGEYLPCNTEAEFVYGLIHGRIYRKVEKEIDWREEVMEYLYSNDYHLSKITDGDWIEINQNFKNEEFLELCRVALRANGEL